ncbi:hypothetical protein Dimus_017817 [Dionaea muscipula]
MTGLPRCQWRRCGGALANVVSCGFLVDHFDMIYFVEIGVVIPGLSYSMLSKIMYLSFFWGLLIFWIFCSIVVSIYCILDLHDHRVGLLSCVYYKHQKLIRGLFV